MLGEVVLQLTEVVESLVTFYMGRKQRPDHPTFNLTFGAHIPDPLVASGGMFAKLHHVSQNGQRPIRERSCKGPEGGFNGAGVGVVAIYNHGVDGSFDGLATLADGLELHQCLGDGLRRYTEVLAHCYGRGHVGQLMLAFKLHCSGAPSFVPWSRRGGTI